jgi:hypothetical protein
MLIEPSNAALSDFADALVVARRAKRVIVLLLLVMLLAQLAMFFAYRYTGVFDIADAATRPAISLDALHYVSGGVLAVSLMLSIVLPIVLLLICHIMLVGRLVGVGPVVSAFVWSLVLGLILFPWQTLLNVTELTKTDFVLPGVLVTWRELLAGGRFETANLHESILKWTRFVGAPAVAVLLLLIIQLRSGRGLRMGLGEDAPLDNPSN